MIIRAIRKPRRPVVAGAAALLAVLVIGTVALAATVSRNGKSITAVRTVTATDTLNATALTYTDVPGMSTTVSVPADTQALLVITFSAQDRCYYASGGFLCHLRVLVDGASVSPGEITIDRDGSLVWRTLAMQFVAGPVSAGSHTVTVQSRLENVGEFWFSKRTLTVLRSKL